MKPLKIQLQSINPIVNSIILTAGTTLSKILGFVREIVIAAYFGASYLVDAYLVAMIIPQMLFSVVNGALNTTVLPLCTEYERKEGRKSVLRMLNAITTFMTLVLMVLIIISELFSHYLVYLLAPGFAVPVAALATRLTGIMLPMMLFMGLTGMGTGILQSDRRFLYPAFIGIPYNIIIIGSLIVFGHTWGITGLAVGTLLGVVLQWAFQIPDLRRAGFPFKWSLDFSHPGFRKMGRLVLPVIIASGAMQINLVVDRIAASSLVEGTISALNYASKLDLIIYGVLALAVANAIFPEMASAVVEGAHDKLKSSVVRSLNGLFLIIMPVTVGLIVLRYPIVRVAFERGAFDSTGTTLTVTALLFFAFGLPALCLREITMRAFFSLQNTITPMYNGILTVGINVAFIFILTPFMKIGGLALANSLALTIGFIILMWQLRKQVGPLGGKLLVLTGMKITGASVIMGLVVWYLNIWLQEVLSSSHVKDLLVVAVLTGLGFIVYTLSVKLFKIDEFEWVVNKVITKLKRI